jgi:CHASE3 domain sensor protein
MFNSWTFGRRLAVGFGLAALILLIIVFVSFRSTSGLVDNNGLVSHSHVVETKLTDLLSELKDAETGQRGYIITGNEDYLAPYRAALDTIPVTMQDLRQLTSDNPAQQQRLDALQPLIDAKLAELKQTIDLRRGAGFDAALKVVADNSGKVIMDKARGLIADATTAEDQLLLARTHKVEESAKGAMAITIWGGIAGVLAVAAIGWFITRSLSAQISSAVGQIQSSSTELQAAASQQATGAKEQSAATSEITTTISELLATSRQIAESAQRVSQIADQTAGAAHSGQGMVDLTRESISGIRRQVDQIVADMLELGKKSQEIGAVLDIVSELAEQTNILAINATIEAVGAGESGLRFGVVADEIRKLADRVGGSTKEIRTLIDDVRSAVNTTVMATETGSKAVDAGARQFGDVSAAFNEISGLVTTTTEAAREIELSTKQQTTAVEQVNIAIVNVAQASKETESSSGQTLLTASQLAELSKQLMRIVHPKAA